MPWYKEDSLKIIFFTFTKCHIATFSKKKHCPRGREIYKFGKPFLGQHNFTLSLSDLCRKVEKTIVEKLMH